MGGLEDFFVFKPKGYKPLNRKSIIFPYLFALYPILGLYARNLTEIEPNEILRPALIATAFTFFGMTILNKLIKDPERTAFIVGFLVFFYSGSGLGYRIIEGLFIKGLGESFHRVMIIIAFLLIWILGNRGVWLKYLNLPRRKILTDALNYMSLVIMIFPVLTIGNFWYKAFDDAKAPWSNYVSTSDDILPVSEYKPDIYYIILDGYGRRDVLEKIYHFDNSVFLNSLEDRGFYIASESRANYLRTSLSITSALNMDYLNFTKDLAGSESTNRIPLFELASNNRARQLLQRAGYKFILIDSGSAFTRFQDADYFLTPFKTRLSLFEMWYYSTTAINVLYEPALPITSSLEDLFPVAGYSVHRRFVTGALENLKNVPDINGPKFTLAHMIIPHPPFTLSEDGTPLHPDYPYVTGDGASFVSDPQTYVDGYLGQVQFINNQILNVVDNIIGRSAIPPIIILQSDHGPGYLFLSEGDTSESCLWERASILNAYYLPGHNNSDLSPAITPVNSFRVIFNSVFGSQLEILEEKTYFSLFDVPYNFVDVTQSIQSPCGIKSSQ